MARYRTTADWVFFGALVLWFVIAVVNVFFR